MIQLLKSFLNAKTGDTPVRRPVNIPSDFRAVSLAPSRECCAATKGVASRRYLWRQAPRLPLAGCEMGSNCACKFIKHTDRRDGDRRLLGCTSTNQWFAGGERRRHRGRRAA